MRVFVTVFLLLVGSNAFTQPNFQEVGFTGKVVGLRSGWGFAYEAIEMLINGDTRSFRLDPGYGQSVLARIKIGHSSRGWKI